MTLDKDGRILLSVPELVAISRRKLARITAAPDVSDVSEKGFTKNIELMGFPIQLFGAYDGIEGSELTLSLKLSQDKSAPDREDVKQLRGELFILGYLLAEEKEFSEVRLTALYEGKSCPRKAESETVPRSTLKKFYQSCISSLERYGLPELKRVTERIPTLASVKFPFKEVRDGQSELVRSVYRSIARGGELLISAPTGTGKTVSVIYPAIRAIGDGRCERVFYLTPKTTTANAAADCINLLASYGAKIRAVRLTAKEKICHIRAVCKDDPSLCTLEREKGISDAVLKLSELEMPVIGEADIKIIANECGVCPYELSLAYSELCDFIICDVNYVFDPSVYLRRYFDTGGEYALLIDEAHNLVSRAREMYSCEISYMELIALSDEGRTAGLSGGFCDSVASLSEELKNIIYPFLRENIRTGADGVQFAAEHLTEIPPLMYGIVDALHTLTEDELMRQIRSSAKEKSTRVAFLKDFAHKISKVKTVTELFGDGFKLLLFLEGDNIKFKLFCIDTGSIIKERLKLVRSAAFFSATLEPIDYYRDALGADRSSECVSVKSPFDPEALSVTIMDKISTRISERERTKDAVCRAIAATLSARRGHYMVYAPSFEYAELLYRTFTAKYPKIKALLHTPNMSGTERDGFLSAFDGGGESYLIGFSVMGGIYSEGVDLAGHSLIGAIVVGIGIPSLSYEREAIAEYYEDKLEAGRQYAYIFPGMNKVFQAAGRVIRREDDRGVIVLIDDRFDDPIYKKSIPDLWRGMRYCGDPKELRVILDAFWKKVDGE